MSERNARIVFGDQARAAAAMTCGSTAALSIASARTSPTTSSAPAGGVLCLRGRDNLPLSRLRIRANLTESSSGLKDGVDAPLSNSRYGPAYSAKMVSAIASCTAAITRLDARFCVSSVASAWARRAAWSGYTRALQLQSAEIDEIDVFSWGCGLQIPGRPLRSTNLDLFDRFPAWEAALRDPDPLAWRDALPTAIGEIEIAADHSPLIRALDRVRQHARLDSTALPWLSLPFALRDKGMVTTPLPCLVGGVKAFRLKRTVGDEDWYAAMRSLEASATANLARLHELEKLHRAAQHAIVAEYRPGHLPGLAALLHHRPLLSPQSLAELLSMSVAGASKLLGRAVDCGLLVEITQRRTWRVFLSTDLAIEFGFAAPKRGRPRNMVPPPPASRELSEVFDAFDREMENIDKLLQHRAESL
ncbi:hypothetical protein LTR94_025178 [Friedmanniomyces endolithicus]|nr:hypothetical protein LTR94_025178 [Friedmanniomyces endolithicus]